MKQHNFLAIIFSFIIILVSSCSKDADSKSEAESDSESYSGDRGNMPTRRYHASKRDIIASAYNLRQIGLAIRMYGDDHRGAYVDEIGYKAYKILCKNSKYLEFDPDHENQIYQNKGSYTTKAYSLEELEEKHVDHAIITKGLRDNTARASQTPIAFSKPGTLGDTFNVLFVDGHVKDYKSDAQTCEEFVHFLAQELGGRVDETCLENAKALDKVLFGETEKND